MKFKYILMILSISTLLPSCKVLDILATEDSFYEEKNEKLSLLRK